MVSILTLSLEEIAFTKSEILNFIKIALNVTESSTAFENIIKLEFYIFHAYLVRNL